MTSSRVVQVRLNLETSSYLRGIKEVEKANENLIKSAQGSAEKQRQALDDLAGSAGKIAGVATVGLGAMGATAANFDQAMSNVAATGDDARASMDRLRDAAVKAGADTAFNATEAAAGIENLLKAGVSAEDVLSGGLSGALDLAAAGELQVADAAEIAATALTQFKLNGEDVPHVADLLAAAAGKAQGDVSDMSMALEQSGLVASQMGLSIEETTGTLAAFASAGLLGSDAGTSFRTMLLRLANPTEESAKLMRRLGIEAYDASGEFVGMSGVAGQLQRAFEGKTQAERDSAMATLFGSDAIRAATVLFSQGAQGIDDWTGKVDDAGYAADTAATRLDNLKGDLEAFLGALETALIGAGEGSQGALREMVQTATDAVNVFNELPSGVKSTATTVVALTAALGGTFWMGNKVVGTYRNISTSIATLGTRADGTARSVRNLATVANGVRAAAGIALIADQATGASESLGLQNTASLALMGTMVGPWGAAIGGGTGLLLDMAAATATTRSETKALTDQMKQMGASFDDFGAVKDHIDELRETTLGEALGGGVKSLWSAINVFDGTANPLKSFKETALADLDIADEVEAQAQRTIAARLAEQKAAAAQGQAIKDLIAVRRAERDEALAAENAQLQYNRTRKESEEAAKDYSGVLDGVRTAEDAVTRKQQEAYSVLLQQVSGWNDLDDATKDMPGRYGKAREALVKTARQMGMSEEAAKALADRLLDIPEKVQTRAHFYDEDARAALHNYRSELDKMNGKTITQYAKLLITGQGPAGGGPNRPTTGDVGDIIDRPLRKKAAGGCIAYAGPVPNYDHLTGATS